MKRLALFAHYDNEDEIKPYVLHLLQNIRQECDAIVFVTTGDLSEKTLATARRYCIDTFRKENVGLDFCMWKHAIHRIDLDQWDELVLVNSSIIGPLWPLYPIFKAMNQRSCDFWGMTDNTEITWHLQSYFLVFKAAALHSQSFRAFWDSVLPYRNKDQIIRSYEVGLTIYLQDHGLRGEPFARMADLPRAGAWPFRTRKQKIHNPTCYRPIDLLASGMPFVKIELLRDNPAGIALGPVYRRIESAGYDLGMIPVPRNKKSPDPTTTRRSIPNAHVDTPLR